MPLTVHHRHRLTAAAGAALLATAVAGCSGLGRTAVGTIEYETADKHHVMLTSPLVTGCHRTTDPGAVSVVNSTLVDMMMYPTDDCSGDQSIYVPTTTSNIVAPGAGVWRAFSFVH
ncbi:hypothetical protein [Streptomyces clavuligerus]|uniref:Uncharacterized protein n=1 Tax=Streptomyces clavuligerus TaxID=1901 RepID=E2PUK8_STRCL|nr:hypothetical protein [Streptomyces clavuligerus]ANW19421.1 hypothetical protein BB341_14940 [Streptomyces clavuligerus]AXU14028.1 hypothetical protein D1794_15585 [Streptomyces clavuligerus]EFG07787.1 Hypothetical protein SCLAV_2715 [Streptomyces clavuligerus]MBY6304006.1 hypothetical protein [Streptomyces clavuligerus]QCS06801.1 hypothetical protein CRV15_14940 [Streptomyces clavuligerus]